MNKTTRVRAPNHQWTDAEIAMLRRMYSHYTHVRIAEELKLTTGQVFAKLSALGISTGNPRGGVPKANLMPEDDVDAIPSDARRINSGIVYQPEPGRTVHRIGVGR